MKRCGQRASLTAGAISIVVIAVVVAFNWSVVRDHAEAWWFQATRETKTVTGTNIFLPGPATAESQRIRFGPNQERVRTR